MHGLELNGAERTTIIVDIFNIVHKARDTGIYLKVDEEPKSSRPEGHKIKEREEEADEQRTHVILS